MSDVMGRRHSSRLIQQIERIEKERDDARTALAEIAAALSNYGRHYPGCSAYQLGPVTAACSCGLSQLLTTHAAAIRGAKG